MMIPDGSSPPIQMIGLDPLPGLAAGVGAPAGGIHEAAVAQLVDDGGQLFPRQVVDSAELLRLHAEGECHWTWASVPDEGGVLAVSAVLPQQRRRLPEPATGSPVTVECPEPGARRTAHGPRSAR
jgi:hypothetical protein